MNRRPSSYIFARIKLPTTCDGQYCARRCRLGSGCLIAALCSACRPSLRPPGSQYCEQDLSLSTVLEESEEADTAESAGEPSPNSTEPLEAEPEVSRTSRGTHPVILAYNLNNNNNNRNFPCTYRHMRLLLLAAQSACSCILIKRGAGRFHDFWRLGLLLLSDGMQTGREKADDVVH